MLLMLCLGVIVVLYLFDIDDVIVCDVLWVKYVNVVDVDQICVLVDILCDGVFDVVVIFIVYMQNLLLVVMLCFLVGILLCFVYCCENLYVLLIDWIVDFDVCIVVIVFGDVCYEVCC